MSTNIQVCPERLFLLRIVGVILYDGINNMDLLENVFSNYYLLNKSFKSPSTQLLLRCMGRE